MVANCGGKNSLRACTFLERHLACACETMPYLSPVNQVATVKDGHTWKIFTRGGDKIIILTYATDTRIGVKARNYWITIHTWLFHYPVYFVKARFIRFFTIEPCLKAFILKKGLPLYSYRRGACVRCQQPAPLYRQYTPENVDSSVQSPFCHLQSYISLAHCQGVRLRRQCLR